MRRALLLFAVLLLAAIGVADARNKYMVAPVSFYYARGSVGINAGGAVVVTFSSGDERTWAWTVHNRHTAKLIVCASSVDCSTATTPADNSAGTTWTVSDGIGLIEAGEIVTLDFKDTGLGARMATSTGPASFWATE